MQNQTQHTPEQKNTTQQQTIQKQTDSPYQTKEGQKAPIQAKHRPVSSQHQPVQRKATKSAEIAQTMGAQYGVDTSGLQFNHNSSFPGKVNAEATIQGNKIDFAPGKDSEANIKHEIGHHIVNTQRGTSPKADSKVNGQAINTSDEAAADKIMNAPLQRKVESETSNSILATTNNTESPIQRKKILNLAAGTEINNFEKPQKDGDSVLNTDRGDMLAARFVLQNPEAFAKPLSEALSDEQALDNAKNRLRSQEYDDEMLQDQVKKEQVNKWFYTTLKGDINTIFKIITEIFPDFKKEIDTYAQRDDFAFGAVGPKMGLGSNSFDEIHMVSGHGIKVFNDEATLQELYKILAPGGSLMIKGNRAVLRGNGLMISSDTVMVGDQEYLNPNGQELTYKNEKMIGKYFELEDWGVKEYGKGETSEHTMGGGFAEEDQFHELWFKSKKS